MAGPVATPSPTPRNAAGAGRPYSENDMTPAPLNRQQRRQMERQQARQRAMRRVERPWHMPMIMKARNAIGPLEDWLNQIEANGTAYSVQGEPLIFNHSDNCAYPAAGAIDGIADLFEMWSIRHGKPMNVEPLRQLAARLGNGAPIDAPLLERVRAVLPKLQAIGVHMNQDDAEDLIRQTQIKAELGTRT